MSTEGQPLHFTFERVRGSIQAISMYLLTEASLRLRHRSRPTSRLYQRRPLWAHQLPGIQLHHRPIPEDAVQHHLQRRIPARAPSRHGRQGQLCGTAGTPPSGAGRCQPGSRFPRSGVRPAVFASLCRTSPPRPGQAYWLELTPQPWFEDVLPAQTSPRTMPPLSRPIWPILAIPTPLANNNTRPLP